MSSPHGTFKSAVLCKPCHGVLQPSELNCPEILNLFLKFKYSGLLLFCLAFYFLNKHIPNVYFQ